LPKLRHLRTIAQLCRAISSKLWHISTVGKKLLNSNISSTCRYNMVNVGPLASKTVGGFGAPSKFQRVSRLVGFVTALASLNGGQPNFARCLAVSWASILYIHLGVLAPKTILPGAKFTLRPSFAFSYIGNVTARHWSSGRLPNFAAFSRGRHLYSTGRPSRWTSAHILVALCSLYVQWESLNFMDAFHN